MQDSDAAALILPSLVADIAVKPNKGGENGRLFDSLLGLGAGNFMLSVRALPLEELEVQVNEEIFLVKRFSDGKIGVKLPKCKELLSESRVFTFSTEIACSEYSIDGLKVRVIKCSDINTLSADALKALLLSEERLYDLAVGYSLSDIVELKTASHSASAVRDTLAAALSVCFRHLTGRRENLKFSSSQGEFELRLFEGDTYLLE